MRKRSCILAQAVCCVLVFLALGCGQQQPPADTRAADEAAIRETDMAWSKAAAAKQVDAMPSYYAEDGSMLPPNAPIVTGREAIHKTWTQLFETPGFSVSWQPAKVEVARSGDLAYSQGTYELTMNDPKGNPVQDRGKYVVVWRKGADGSWKAVADMFNSDLSPAAPPAK